MEELFKNLPQIIAEAAKSPLGIFALMIVIVTFVALAFFYRASYWVKGAVFVLMFIGAGLFGYVILHTTREIIHKSEMGGESDTLIEEIRNAHGTIECGKMMRGHIPTPGATNEITFNAKAGEKIAIAVTNLSNNSPSFRPCWELFDPSGSRIGYKQCGGNLDIILKLDGLYKIIVFSDDSSGKGDYSIRLEPVSSSFNGKLSCAKEIECGKPMKSKLEVNNAAHSYRFSAKSGEVVAIAVTQLSIDSILFQPCWELFDPSGNRIGYKQCGGNLDVVLQLDGIFTIRVFDDGMDGKGEYSVRLEPASANLNGKPSCAKVVEWVECEEKVYTTKLPENNAKDSYRFLGKAGDKISITLTNKGIHASFQPRWELLNQSGIRIGYSYVDGKNHDIILERDGFFTIRVFDEGYDGKDKYQISIKKSCSK